MEGGDLTVVVMNIGFFVKQGVFHKYYSGELVAPVLTVFIGGNHEASSYLQVKIVLPAEMNDVRARLGSHLWG